MRPQAQIKSKLFSPAACTSGKILLALQVWNFCAESAEIMRAAGCNPLQMRAQRSGKRESKSLILLLEFIQRSRTYAELRELAARSADLGENPNAQRLAKSNPYSVEGLLQRKNKFLMQYSTTPGLKKQA